MQGIMEDVLNKLDGLEQLIVPEARATDRRLVMWKVNRTITEKANLTTVTAEHCRSGFIIISPCPGTCGTRDEFMKRVNYGRFVVNPVTRTGLNKQVIQGIPSIVPMGRVETRCPECGTMSVEYFDHVIARTRTGNGGVPCVRKSCDCKNIEVKPLTQTLIKAGPGLDPILDESEAGLLDKMVDTYMSVTRPDEQPLTILPRIWCAYEGQAPDPTWVPQDKYATLLAKLASQHAKNLSILPFEVARPYHLPTGPINNSLAAVWLDAPSMMLCGWARKSEICPPNINESRSQHGYQRVFWKPGTAKVRCYETPVV